MQASYSVQALTSQPIAATIRKILKDSRAQLSEGRPMITVATFVHAALLANIGKASAAQVVQELFGDEMRSNDFDKLVGTTVENPEGEVSEGLWRAFEEAHDIRRRTGGKDNFIGLRHVLFAIFTSKEPPLFQDSTELLRAVSVDRSQAAQAILDFCTGHLETKEKLSGWEEVLTDRGIQVEPPDPKAKPGPRRLTIFVRQSEVALLQADDPWSTQIRDRSGAGAEAEAFAAMICASQFVPPLAVGVFGQWGSGKSFFMKLVHQAIERRSLPPPKSPPGQARPAPAPADVKFLTNVVQIRFNAWHYAETNLWASLVEHIFTSLDHWADERNDAPKADQLFEQLETAKRLTVEAAETLIRRRLERKAAADNLLKAEKAVEAKRLSLEAKPKTWVAAAWKKIAGPATEKQRLEQAGATLGLGGVSASAQDLRNAAAELDDNLARYAIFKGATVRALAAPVVVAGIAAGSLLLPLLFAWVSARIDASIPPIAAAVSGFFTPIVVALGIAADKTRKAVGVVKDFRARLEAEIDKKMTEEKQQKTEAEKSLAEAESAASEAEGRLKLATDEVAAAASEYNMYTGKARVLRFVRERVANREYEKHLTFVATVRKDFEQLSNLMAPAPTAAADTKRVRKQHQARVQKLLDEAGTLLEQEEKAKLQATLADPPAGPAVFERIVLYIDDLDRCDADKVVEVLQAVHLLLTFPLFVVFVAVDVRWLKQALHKSYPDALALAQTPASATPSDYLEKIFQVPYWVRAMTADSTRALLADRMGPEEGSLPPLQGTGKAAPLRGQQSARRRQEGASTPAASGQGPTSLRLTPNERAFIDSLAETLDHSPRRTLRFINTYRIIKASYSAADLQDLEDRGYKALLTLLAVTVNGKALPDAFIKLTAPGAKSDEREDPAEKARRQKALNLFNAAGGNRADLSRYAPLVARFSFEPAGA